ncbi:brain protein I3-like [Actinia tenebrosa]|uniref:Membrane protein BRI3 n=1 Tax=Actinia tenebrosa TaxID=6105 RepID=A0A6P8HTT9_ACTTE|nr:brain protein I3-like [Actinia tenebrosa]
MSDMNKPPGGGYSQPTAPVYQSQPGYGPPQGYQGPPPSGYQSGAPANYGAPPTGYQTVPATTTTHVYVRGSGNCPACGVGNTQSEFTILGICLAILFFPIGILCCLLLTEKRCNNCGMTYS